MAKKSTDSLKNDAATEFSRLFWLARKEHRHRGKKAATSDTDHQSALAFARVQGWSWAESLLEASRLEWVTESDKSLRLLAECESTVPGPWHGLFHFLRGATHQSKQDHDEAIKAYRKAIDDPKFDARGRAWFNLGNALADKGEYDEAINAYSKAIDDPKSSSPGNAWNNLGLVHSAKGEHDEAIKAYQKAIGDPKCESIGNAWNNLGNALADKGEHDEAIKAYQKAIGDPKYEYHARAWTNLAQAYVGAGKQKDAKEAFEKALASVDHLGGDHARARLGLLLLKAKMEPAALSPDDRAMSGKSAAGTITDEIECGVIAAIQAAGDTQYEKYITKPDSKRDDTLSILRGWSSAVTLLEGSERRWRGGGYFLKWRGYGIVIDPGFDFLRNFHDAGYHGREIHGVIVSHNHPDHNSDVKDIDDLRYELFKRLSKPTKLDCQPYVLLWDQDTDGATKFGFEKPKHQHEPVILPSGFPQAINLLDHPAKIPVRVTPFKVNHGSDVSHAMGMVVELLDKNGKSAVRIGYTADTAYFEDLHKHLAGCDILIAHISQPSIEELQDASKFKEVHLGYRGTARLLKECQPKLALIGEFWAGFTDLRISLVKGLRQRSGVQAVLPAGLAMHLRLPSLEIECTECKKPTPFPEIKVAPPTDNFGSLAYLCPGCMIG
jgi:tetratricopeptide (TPR) repeat protein/ribonuclease BN (tRNA processing enzyme)